MARGATSQILIVVVAALVLSSAATAWAQDRARLEDPFEITADQIDYDGPRDLYVATGNVRVLQVDRSLHADWVAFSTSTRMGVAQGSVRLDDAGDVLYSEFMVFDVDSLQGMLFEGGLDAGSEGFKVRAAEMIRTGRNTFSIRDGVFTTCRCPESDTVPWQISTSQADVELGGYGMVRNATFDVLGVPVLWVPWAFFPVKSDRETGLLLPQIEVGGRSGIGGGIPFFWAAHPQVNVTVTPRGYSERGFKGDGEIEYVFGKASAGELFVSGLYDYKDESVSAKNRRRWGLRWFHDHELPAEWRWQTDLNLSSDNFYNDDFNEFREFRRNLFIESTTNVNRSFGKAGGVGVMIGARYADDVQGLQVPVPAPGSSDNFSDADASILQRFGEGRLDVQPGTLVAPLGIEARFDSQVIHFRSWRDHESIFPDQGFQPVVGDGRFYDVGVDGNAAVLNFAGQPVVPNGRFDPGEAIAERGTRAIIHPRLARPFRLGDVAELVPEVGWHQSLYTTDQQKFAQRGLLTARVDLRSRLARDFSLDGDGEESGRMLRHVLEPRLGWALVSSQQQKDNPLFVPQGSVNQTRLRALSLENVTRDPSDRIESSNRVVLGLGQRFYARRHRGAGLSLKADVQTAIDWDFANDGLGRAYLDARMMGLGPFAARLAGAFNPETVILEEARAELGYLKRFGGPWLKSLRLNGAYRYRSRIPTFLESNRGRGRINETDVVNQVNLLVEMQLTQRFRLQHNTIYKLGGDNEFIRNQDSVEYVSKCRCWAIGASVAFDRNDQISGGFSVRFLGLGDSGASLFGKGIGTGINF